MALHLGLGFFRRPLPPVLLLSNSNGSGIFVAIAHRRKITDLTTAGTADSHSIYSSNLDFCMLTLPQLYPSCLSKEGGGFSAHVIFWRSHSKSNILQNAWKTQTRQYIPHFLMDCLRKRTRAARKNVSNLKSFFSILLKNRPDCEKS